MNSKKFYLSVLFVAFASGLLLLITLKSNNRKVNPNLLSNIYSLYNESITNSSIFNLKMGYNTSIPFEVNLRDDGECININGRKLNFNKLCVEDITYALEILNNFLDKNNIYETNIYKQVIFRYLIDYRDKTDYSEIFENIVKKLEINKLNVYLKYIYYDNDTKLFSEGFYKNLKKFNSKSVFEELRDKESLNILIYNSTENNMYYNEDINQDIFEINLKDKYSYIFLKKFIDYRMINIDIKKGFKNNNYLDDLVILLNSKDLTYYKLFIETIRNLEVYNKFASNYESIKTFDKVKDKLNLIQNNFIDIARNNLFNITDIQISLITENFIISKYLLESNEFAIFDHYFSFEFKIGTFLPVMLPLLYGFVKAIKAIANK